MEIRLLYGNELQWAVYTANEVYEGCVRPYAASSDEVAQYYNYVKVENLWQEMSAGRLCLWGAFENGQMCGVSAMQDVGHITMLYVKPYYAKRHVGTELVNRMCVYAASMLRRERVTICVSPAVASYFYHIGFTLIQGSALGQNYVPLERRIWLVPQTDPVNMGYGMQQAYRGNAGYGMPQAYPGNTGYGMPQAYPGNAGYGMPQVYPGNVGYGMPAAAPKREVTYPTRKVSARRILALAAGVLLFAFVVITGVTVHHMVKDGPMQRTVSEGTEEELPEEFGEIEEL